MIATMKFKLPEETEEYEAFTDAFKARHTLTTVREHLRSRLKYADLGEEATKELTTLQALLFEHLKDMHEF